MTSNGNKVGAHNSIESLHGVPPVNARHHHFSLACKPSMAVVDWCIGIRGSDIASCAMRDPFIAMDPSIPGTLHHIRVCLFHGPQFPSVFPLFHHASSSSSQTLWLCFGWELSLFEVGNGALFILCLHYVLRQCTRISGVLFLCAYRTYKTCLHDATCQSTQTLYSSVLAENNRHFEISKWCIDEVMLPYVHRRSYAVLRASTMYLYLYMSYFPVCFPHFFTCLHYASWQSQTLCLFGWEWSPFWIPEWCIVHVMLCLTCIDNVLVPLEFFFCVFPAFFHVPSLCILSIANSMPLFCLGIVAIWMPERCIVHLILCLPCVDNVPESLHRTMYLHPWSQLRAVILKLGRLLKFGKGALFVH